MKMSPEVFDKLKDACQKVLDNNGYTADQINTTREMWTVFFASRHYYDFYQENKDLHDNHIETALRKIFK
jgi:hypothetical protein